MAVLPNFVFDLVPIAIVLGFALSISYGLGFCIYRLYFHPLARFPGPFLARISSLYGGYHAWKGDLHIDIWRCHEKYGDFVRYGPNRVLFNTSSSLKEIYSHSKHIQKSSGYKIMVHKAPNTFTAIERSVHEKKRRVVSQGFSDAALRTYEPKMLECVDKLCHQIDKKISAGTHDTFYIPVQGSLNAVTWKHSENWSSALNMGDIAGYFAFDFMTELVFGISYSLQEKEEFRYVVASIAGSNVRTGTLCQAPILQWRRLDRHLFQTSILARNRFMGFVDRLMKDRMNAKNIHGDVFSLLLKAKDPNTGQVLDSRQLGAESVNLIVAGSDTTATTMAALMFYLCHYPKAYTKVTAEIRAAFPNANSVRLGPELNSCIYLRACLDETLRMSPAVGSALWREVLGGGLIIDGNYVPAGTDVGTGIYSIHHKEEYFHQPFVFHPERWMDGKEINPAMAEKMASGRVAYNPFSIGGRGCIGKSLAVNQLLLTMARLIVEFDFKSASGLTRSTDSVFGSQDFNEYQMKDHLIGCRDGPMVKFRKVPVVA